MKKLIFSRICALALSTAMLLGLTACAAPAAEPPATETEAAAATPAPTPEATPVAEVEPPELITINFPSIWVAKDSKAGPVKAIVDQFNADNAGLIEVVIEEISDYQAYRDKIRTNITAGMAPDVFSFDNVLTEGPIMYGSGNLMDLTPHLTDEWRGDFLPDAVKAMTIDGKIMALPYEFGVTPVIYNRALLEKAGVTEIPATMDEFFDALAKLKAAGITPMSQMTGDNAWTSMLWYSQLVLSYGGPDVYARGLSDPAFLQAAEALLRMFEYANSDAVGATASIASGHWLNERTAIFMNGPWFIGRIRNEGVNNIYDNTVVAPAPAAPAGQGQAGGYLGFIQAALAAGVQEDPAKEAAVVKFLQAMTNPDAVKRMSLETGTMFVVQFDITAEDEVERIQADMISQMNDAPYVVPHFNAMMKPAVVSEFPMALSSMVLGETTPEQFVQTLSDIDAIN